MHIDCFSAYGQYHAQCKNKIKIETPEPGFMNFSKNGNLSTLLHEKLNRFNFNFENCG
jgi:hypothetical protein